MVIPRVKNLRSVFSRGLRLATAVAVAAALCAPPPALASSRIKDLVDIEGVRENQLIGYGLVVGLNGTGDTLNNSPFTLQSLQAMLERLGMNTRDAQLRTKNVAAVMVTANLPAFSTHGSRIDVTVSTLGDSTNLQGGTLLVTPLLGADGEVYAVAQGPVAVAGFNVEGEAAQVTRGVPTSGRIANGALIEREIDFELSQLASLRLALRNPDLTTATRIAQSINDYIGPGTAEATDPATVQIRMSGKYSSDIVSLLTDIEQLRVDPDQPARVVIDENSGIIVMGKDVRVSTVAVAQGNLTVTITETPEVSQPGAFAPFGAETVEVPRTQITVDDQSGNRMAIVDGGVSLQQLVDGLNALGVGPRDLISILQAIKTSGSLQADIEVM
ncbi:flagellar basal body P-ring protein FlgI [Microbaculum marinisediminis]|uniref:flagellar basal body P-ring protein FlgI n=1 Tax=Microbaculum marinisediminis TaxID=2931392 RepID=UPI003CC58367